MRLLTKIFDNLLNLFLGLAALAVLWIFMQVFLFTSFRIPSDSMEPILEAGDCVFVNKLMLGARLFNLSASMNGEQVQIHRTPGIRNVQHNDVLVFNFPHPNAWDKIEMHIMKYYIKRCVGLPGDTLVIRDGQIRVDGLSIPLGNTDAQKRIGRMHPEEFEDGVYKSFPYDSVVNWNIQAFGPLYIPKAGDKIQMNRTNFVLYRKLIEWEQKGKLNYQDSTVYMNEKPIDMYCFLKNYYFMAGDKSENSQDSRYWGMLPEEYIVGKASFIWKSVDPYTGKWRWERFLKEIR